MSGLSKEQLEWGMGEARKASQKSVDPSHKVGTFIGYLGYIGGQRTLIAEGIGWNQNPVVRGSGLIQDNEIEDTPEFYEDGQKKKAFILHAEAYAILEVLENGGSCVGSVCFSTHSPCSQCASLLVATGVAEIVLPATEELMNERYGQKEALEFLAKAGVEITRI
jgi:deoxycytidylate deaminase